MNTRRIDPGSFEPSAHFYPRVLNAQINPLVRALLMLDKGRIATRYCHLHPEASPDAVRELLAHTPQHFRWGGADLFATTTAQGVRRVVVIETNSCPSGQKSMPLAEEHQEQAGYRTLLERAFLPFLAKRHLPRGHLAVIYDKNPMEASGYAAAMADLCGEPVYLAPCTDGAAAPETRVRDGVIEVLHDGAWQPIRAALRYVTQRPWNRIPVIARTAVFNPVLICLSGGRNKMLAAKAYDLFNAEVDAAGLAIATPETMWDVNKEEIPLWVARMGGLAVVKIPYSNAGQGVYTITNQAELDEFMARDHHYHRFVVQALIGNLNWSSHSAAGRLYHLGTIPNKRGEIYAADLRFMVGAGPDGFFPVAIYARRARKPLATDLAGAAPSWDMLGTNLSVKHPDGSWTSDTDRLLLMDSRDFNRIGIGLDDLIEAFIQTVMAVTAIDRMACRLVGQRGKFRKRLFRSLNPDSALVEEIMP